ncbi:hypothetical protein HPB48_007789 [Haemaphysalis longicornis]|uniref:Uncharacterized protein n=1 Tax=Haemaphysalis longicornis TaxID=44386 RepID=A0A9J6GEB6_HAELO|nr:hypothetical protein HPB48_007789 [Haemaphysalis longicornis]
MPDLPHEDMKIIVRPRGGLRVSDVTRVELSRALTAAAQIPAIESRKDVVCLNAQQTIVVVSTSRGRTPTGMLPWSGSTYVARPTRSVHDPPKALSGDRDTARDTTHEGRSHEPRQL